MISRRFTARSESFISSKTSIDAEKLTIHYTHDLALVFRAGVNGLMLISTGEDPFLHSSTYVCVIPTVVNPV